MLLTLDLLKKHVRAEDFTDDDDCLRLYLEAATEWATLYTHRTATDLHSLAPDGEQGGYPVTFVQAVLLLAAAYYDQREATAGTALTAAPYGVEALLKPYRRLYAPDQLSGEAYVTAGEARSAASAEYVAQPGG